MVLRRLGCVLLVLLSSSLCASASLRKSCISPEKAMLVVDKEICVSAHIYDVVELSDGTRFLDVCSPDTREENCRFTILSLREDRGDVGELRKYRDTDVQVRGIVRSMHGRAGIVVSHARQFQGGAPKFRPNPRLLQDFNAEQDSPAVRDPNLRHQGGRHASLNTRDTEPTPTK